MIAIRLLSNACIYGFFFWALLGTGCTRNEVVEPEPPHVEQSLVGEWYYVSPNPFPSPGPPRAVHGFQLTPDSIWNQLGVEITTGRLTVMNGGYRDSLIAIRSDTILLNEYWYPEDSRVDTLLYSFLDDTLEIRSPPFRGVKYLRSNLNAIVSEAVPSMMRAMIGNVSVKAESVWWYPSVFVSHKLDNSDFSFYIHSHLIGKRIIHIGLYRFNGIGEYSLGASGPPMSFGSVVWGYPESTQSFVTNSANSGRLVIDQYDDLSNRCAGRFEFRAIRTSAPFDTVVVTDGEFDARIYRVSAP